MRNSTVLSVVTVLFNSERVFPLSFPTWLEGATNLPIEFIVFDNSPNEVVTAFLAEIDSPTINYIRSETNIGFAGGANSAIERAQGSHVLLLNPDVWLLPDSCEQILDAIETWGERPIAISMNTKGVKQCGIRLNCFGSFADRLVGSGSQLMGPSGGAGVYSKRLLKTYGGLTESLFAWGEDAELAFHMYAGGVRTVELDLQLAHLGGHSIEDSDDGRRMKAYLMARNRLLVLRSCFTLPAALLLAPCYILMLSLIAAKRVREKSFLGFVRGIRDGMRNRTVTNRVAHRRISLALLAGTAIANSHPPLRIKSRSDRNIERGLHASGVL